MDLSISHSCVHSNLPPSGWLILMGLFVGLMFLAGVPGCRKWPVAPVSTITKSLLIWIGLLALLTVSAGVEQLLMVNVMSSSSLVASAAY